MLSLIKKMKLSFFMFHVLYFGGIRGGGEVICAPRAQNGRVPYYLFRIVVRPAAARYESAGCWIWKWDPDCLHGSHGR